MKKAIKAGLTYQARLERLLTRAFFNEICKGGGDINAIRRWSTRTAKKIMKLGGNG